VASVGRFKARREAAFGTDKTAVTGKATGRRPHKVSILPRLRASLGQTAPW
jgi:hypothetical protein